MKKKKKQVFDSTTITPLVVWGDSMSMSYGIWWAGEGRIRWGIKKDEKAS